VTVCYKTALGSSIMPPATGTGSGKETVTTMDDHAKRFTTMEDLIRPLQPLADVGKNLVMQVMEQGH
jgi:hypothetical protein